MIALRNYQFKIKGKEIKMEILIDKIKKMIKIINKTRVMKIMKKFSSQMETIAQITIIFKDKINKKMGKIKEIIMKMIQKTLK